MAVLIHALSFSSEFRGTFFLYRRDDGTHAHKLLLCFFICRPPKVAHSVLRDPDSFVRSDGGEWIPELHCEAWVPVKHPSLGCLLRPEAGEFEREMWGSSSYERFRDQPPPKKENILYVYTYKYIHIQI